MPNFMFFLTNVQLEENHKILALPDNSLLRALFLMFKCAADEGKIKQFFQEIFKFYHNQPHLKEIAQIYLIYLSISSKMPMEEVMELMSFFSPKEKEDMMTTYEILVNKGEKQGIAKGDKLRILKTVWDASCLKISVSSISELCRMAPSLIQKWLKRFEWMQQSEADGLTPAEIALKVNDLAAEPVVAEWEVEHLLAFFKEQPKPKAKKKRPKKDAPDPQ
jgi:hypothetical protein